MHRFHDKVCREFLVRVLRRIVLPYEVLREWTPEKAARLTTYSILKADLSSIAPNDYSGGNFLCVFVPSAPLQICIATILFFVTDQRTTMSRL